MAVLCSLRCRPPTCAVSALFSSHASHIHQGNFLRQLASVLYDTLPVPFQVLGFVLLTDAGRGRRATDLHLDFRQPVLDLPLLLGQLGVQAEVLRLDGVQTFPQPLDLALEGLVGSQQWRCPGRFDVGQRVARRSEQVVTFVGREPAYRCADTPSTTCRTSSRSSAWSTTAGPTRLGLGSRCLVGRRSTSRPFLAGTVYAGAHRTGRLGLLTAGKLTPMGSWTGHAAVGEDGDRENGQRRQTRKIEVRNAGPLASR